MNKLPPQIKNQLFTDKNEYLALRAHWSQLMNSERKHELTAAHHLLYTALIGRDWRKGFTLTTNQKRLANGAFDGWKLFPALMHLYSQHYETWLLAPFDDLVTSSMMQQIRQIIPRIQPHQCKVEDFMNGRFPFTAFDVSEMIPEGENTME